jgi:phosphonate transport system permease protein
LNTTAQTFTDAKPASRTRARLIGIGILALLVASFASLTGDWSGLFSVDSVKKMFSLFTGFFPPANDTPYLKKIAFATIETLAISWLGTLLAVVAGMLLALPAAGYWGPLVRTPVRFVLNVLRAIPELVWAALLVIAAGLGPFPGTLALALHTSGVLGRLFAESLENASPEPMAALRRNGVAAVPAFCYGTLPTIIPQLVSYTLYRWENNIRAASVLGVAGAGGLGQMLHFHLSLLQYRETGTILLAMILLVALVDALSNQLRNRLLA